MAVLLSNNATGRLGGSIDATQTTISLMSGDGAKYPSPTPGDWFPLTVVNSTGDLEIMRCTARSGDTLTVLRGQEGTIGLAFSVGDRAELRLTQAVIEDVQSDTQTKLDDIQSDTQTKLDGKLGVSDNAVSATRLATARTINGVSFDGSANITLPIVNEAGQVAFFAGDTAPIGWLKASGYTISRVAYPNLFAAIGTTYGAGDGSTTFEIPDLRGEFIRGFDGGRGVDSGRGVGSSQGDAIRNITGGVAGGNRPNLTPNRTDGAIRTGRATGRAALDSGAYYANAFTFDASRVVPVASENRPRNVALLACIKY